MFRRHDDMQGRGLWAIGLLVAGLAAFALLASPSAAQGQCTTPFHASGVQVIEDIPVCNQANGMGQDTIRLGARTQGSNLVSSIQVNLNYNQNSLPTSAQLPFSTAFVVQLGVGTNNAVGPNGNCYWTNDPGWNGAQTWFATIYESSPCNALGLNTGTSATLSWPYYQPPGTVTRYYCNEVDVSYPLWLLTDSLGNPATTIEYGLAQGSPTNPGWAQYVLPALSKVAGGGAQLDPMGTSPGAPIVAVTLNSAQFAQYTVGTTPTMVRTAPTSLLGSVSGNAITLTWNAGPDDFVPKGYGFYVDKTAPGPTTRLNPTAPVGTNAITPGGAQSYTWTAPGPGTYTFTVREANCRGEGAATQVTVVVPPPAPTCTVSPPSPLYPGTLVTFTATTGYSGYTWAGGGSPPGQTGASNSFQTSWPSAGAKTVSVQVIGQPAVSCPAVTVAPPPFPVCAPATLSALTGETKTLTVSGGTPPYAWTGGGTPATGDQDTFSTAFGAAGSHTVFVKDALEQQGACSVTVTAAALPPLTCSPDEQGVDMGEAAELTAAGGDGTYSWSAPGGDPITSPSSTVTTFATTFVEGGLYVVSVTSAGTSAYCMVDVFQPCGGLQAAFTASSTGVEVGQQVTFTDLTGRESEVESYSWDFGDDTKSSLRDPVHMYGSTGVFLVRLSVVEKGSGCSTMHTLEIQVGQVATPGAEEPGAVGSGPGGPPPPIADAGGDRSVKEGSKVTLVGGAVGENPDGLAFSWRLVEGVAGVPSSHQGRTLEFVTPLLAEPDEVLVLVYELRAYRGSQASTPDVVRIAVGLDDQVPVADAGDELFGVRGQTASLDGGKSRDPEGKALTYSWSVAGGAPVTLSGETTATPSFAIPDEGADRFTDLRLTVSDGRWTASDTVRVRFEEKPVPPLGFRVREQSPGLFAFQPDVAGSSYQWEFGDGSMSSEVAPLHRFMPGTYTVQLKVTSATGQDVYSHVVDVASPEPATAGAERSQGSGWIWAIGAVGAVALVAGVAVFALLRRKAA